MNVDLVKNEIRAIKKILNNGCPVRRRLNNTLIADIFREHGYIITRCTIDTIEISNQRNSSFIVFWNYNKNMWIIKDSIFVKISFDNGSFSYCELNDIEKLSGENEIVVSNDYFVHTERVKLSSDRVIY